MLLSILTPTIEERKHQFQILQNKVERQIQSLPYADQVEHLWFLDNRERSIGFKSNHLLDQAKGKFVVFVDDDDDVSKNYVELICDAIKTNPDIDCVGFKGEISFAGSHPHLFVHSVKYKRYFKKKGIYYRVIDEYTLFYLYWIAPIRDTLQEESLEKGYWQELQASAAWHSWSGYSFEAIVYKHLSQIRKKLSIPATAIANSWRYVPTKNVKADGAQIDLLFDRRDAVITLCEIKYSSKAFVINKQYAAQLIKKRDIFVQRTRTKKQIFIVMIAARNIRNNLYSDELISGVVMLDDLFKDP